MSDIASSAAERQLVSTRVFDASRQEVFRAFREPEHLARWWGPKDFRSTIHSFDFRPGGRWELTLHGPDGTDYKNEYVAVEIAEPERIVISHPDPAHDFQLIVTLAEAGANKTQLTWRQVFSSREHFEQVRSFVAQANEQVLDRLEAEVARTT
ncbi:MAG: SRPBCC domain-containing protein [Chthoniobacterales bacterium]|nr:SRPBCC domain-containing protein [Chthoniobacterales bacterium]